MTSPNLFGYKRIRRNLSEIGDKAKAFFTMAAIPDEIRAEISTAYRSLISKLA
jgi:hypothetical protein